MYVYLAVVSKAEIKSLRSGPRRELKRRWGEVIDILSASP
jgi:hypothetical protein